jgi:hypothetical protein
MIGRVEETSASSKPGPRLDSTRLRGARDETRVPTATDHFAAVHQSACGRFCCKSLFALAIKISFGCTRDFRVKMWGTSSPEDKLAGDLGNVIEATSTGGRRSDFFTTEELAPGNLGLLQQYRHERDPRFIGGGYLLIGAKRTAMLRRGNACF